jgi:hypothetical protein
VILDVVAVAVLLLAGNVAFRHFEPFASVWLRLFKTAVTLVVTATISHYFGRTGVMIAIAIALIALVYVHGIWLPKKGVNGWTAEPKETYYALRGWPPPPTKPESRR